MRKILLLGYASEDVRDFQRTVSDLRADNPSAQVVTVATPATRTSVEQFTQFDETIMYPKGHDGFSRLFNITKLFGLLLQVRKARFDESLVVYGNSVSRRYVKYELISFFSGATKRGFVTHFGTERIFPSRSAHLAHIWRRFALGYLLVKYLVVATALFFHVYFAFRDKLFPPAKEPSA